MLDRDLQSSLFFAIDKTTETMLAHQAFSGSTFF